MRRRGIGLAWILMGLALVSVLLGVLWSLSGDSRARARRGMLSLQARLMAQSALNHGLHKVEKSVIYFDQRLPRGGRTRIDVGGEDPAFLRELVGEVDLAGEGRGSWSVRRMQVEVQETSRGDRAFRVTMGAEGAVDMGGERWRESLDGEFRLFARGRDAAGP